MDDKEIKNTNLNNNNSQQNVGSFGVQQLKNQSEDISNINSRINESRTKNLQNRNVNDMTNNVSNNDTPSLEKKDNLEDKGKELEKKDGKKFDPKQMGKNILKRGGNAIANSARNSEDETTRDIANAVSKGVNATKTTVKAAKGSVKVVKALVAFFSTPPGWITAIILFVIILIILIATVFDTAVSSLQLKFGFDSNSSYEQLNEVWEEGMNQNELDTALNDNNAIDCDVSFLANLRINLIGKFNLGNPEEMCLLVQKTMKRWENNNKFSGNYSPGYPLSALYYAFETQNYNLDGKPFIQIQTEEIENENEKKENISTTDLDAISALISSGIYKKDDITKLNNTLNFNSVTENSNGVLDQYVQHVNESYYIYETEENESGVLEGTCKEHKEDNYFASVNKLQLFLRYGSEVSFSYQDDYDKNNAYNKTSNECKDTSSNMSCPYGGCYDYLHFTLTDLSKYEKIADYEKEEDDNAKIEITNGTYGYNSGFIFSTYPRYNPDYTITNEVNYDYKIDKDIEYIMETIDSRQDYINYILGYPSKVSGSIFASNASCTYTFNGKDYSDLKVRLLYTPSGKTNSALNNIEDGTPIKGQELIPFEDYILGVVYAEAGDQNEEILKTYAVAARSAALSAGKIVSEGGNEILEISSSTYDQTYCDPDKGCMKCVSPKDSSILTSITKGLEPSDSICTIWKGTLSNESTIRISVRSVLGSYLTTNSGGVYTAMYDTNVYNRMKTLADSGSDYVEILKQIYPDATLDVSAVCTVGFSGEYTSWRQHSEPWGQRLIADKTMAKVGCFITSHAMMLAASGKVDASFNPGTFLDIIKANNCLSGNSLKSSCAVDAAVGTNNYNYESVELSGYSKENKISRISEYLRDGYLIVLRVKSQASAIQTQSSSSEHYVFVTGVDYDKIFMADPASEVTSVYDKYVDSGVTWFGAYKFS